MSWAAAGIAGGSFLVNKFFGGGGGKQVSQTQPIAFDAGIYNLPTDERNILSQGQFMLTARDLEAAMGGGEGGLGNWMSGAGLGGGGVSAGHASAGHSNAGHAEASLIDMNDEAFKSLPPAYLLEALAQRAGKGAARSYEAGARDINEGFALSGRDVNSPLALYLKNKGKQQAYSGVNDVMGQFYDSFVQNALGRRAGGLSTNANLATGVSTANAGFDTQSSIANAGNATQASIANASMATQASSANASLRAQQSALGLQRAEMLWNHMNDLTRPVDHVQIVGGGGTQEYQPGTMDWVGGFTDILAKGLGRQQGGVPAAYQSPQTFPMQTQTGSSTSTGPYSTSGGYAYNIPRY
jgi:hypothetical protein